MTRKEAQSAMLEFLDKEIAENGEDSIFLMSPMKGKNSWTLKECKESVIRDEAMEGGINLIDDLIAYYKWKEGHKD